MSMVSSTAKSPHGLGGLSGGFVGADVLSNAVNS